jgi:hypothetical protein
MGDKISALPAATSVDGTELIPIVQGGTTKKVTGLILRNPAGVAGGDLTGTYPNPTLASITTAQAGVGSGLAIPVLTVDAKGRVTTLTTVANPALTSQQIAGLSTTAASPLASSGVAGTSLFASRADHQHAYPTAANVGALGATAAASGDLAGNYPGPTLAAITTAQSNVGNSTNIPVISVDAKGRVISLSSVPITSEAGGTVTSITAGTGLDGGTIIESGTISLAAITTAQVNIGSTSQIPVLSINAQGQVTALSSVAFSGGGAPLATTAPAALATAAVVGLSVAAARADHQHIFPTAIQIGALTTSQIAGMSTVAPAALATSAVIGLSTFAARADHQHVYPTAAQVGALGATATAGGDLTGSYPVPTLAAITTAQSNVGSSTVVPVISIDAKGRVSSLTTAAVAAASAFSVSALQTQSLTIDATFAQKIVPFNASSNVVLTLPTDAAATIALGSEIQVMNLSTNQIQLSNSPTVNLNSLNSAFGLTSPYSVVKLAKIGANNWIASGDLIAVSDASYSSVSSLLHLNGANGSTVFTDNAPTPKTWSSVSSAALSDSNFRFGTASLSLNGTSQYISTPQSTDFDFGTGDFTIEAWVYRNSTATFSIFGKLLSTTVSLYLYCGGSGGTQLILYTGGVNLNAGEGLFIHTKPSYLPSLALENNLGALLGAQSANPLAPP